MPKRPTEEELKATRARKSARARAARELRKKVLELRLAGLTMAQIAKALGKNKSTICRLEKKALNSIDQPAADEARKRHDLRLDRALRTAWAILGDDTAPNKERLAASAEVRQLEMDRAKVWGYLAPQQHRHAGVKNAPPVTVAAAVQLGDIADLSDEQLAQVRQVAAEAAQAPAGAAAATADRPGDGAPPPSGNDQSGAV